MEKDIDQAKIENTPPIPPQFQSLEQWLQFLASEFYVLPRYIEGVGWCALSRMLFTIGIFVGLNASGKKGRFCFDSYVNAKAFLESWDGKTRPIVGENGLQADKYYDEKI